MDPPDSVGRREGGEESAEEVTKPSNLPADDPEPPPARQDDFESGDSRGVEAPPKTPPAEPHTLDSSANSSSLDSYSVKAVTFRGRERAILCQNLNGPCPLLAIANVLLLRGDIDVHPDRGEISLKEISQLVAEYALGRSPEGEGGNNQLDTLLNLIPRLQFGLDVNVMFNSVHGFEFTEEMTAFDATGVILRHGWLIDPQDVETQQRVKNLSYNQLVEILVAFKSDGDVNVGSNSAPGGKVGDSLDEIRVSSPAPVKETRDAHSVKEAAALDPSLRPEGEEEKLGEAVGGGSDDIDGLVIEAFLNSTSSQLTYFGLQKLHEDLEEGELCAFFRNNHFATLFKNNGELYLLLTDYGYAREPLVVWERLNQINGDTELLDSEFESITASSAQNFDEIPVQLPAGMQEEGDHDPDLLLALQLQREAEGAASRRSSQQPGNLASDEALARALQQEYEAEAIAQDRGRRRSAEPARQEMRQERRSQGSSCTVQ